MSLRWEIDSYFNNVKYKKISGGEAELLDPSWASGRLKRLESIGKAKSSILRKKIFRRIVADRDIILEPKSEKMELLENGLGATNIIQRYITHSEHDRGIIQTRLLHGLNSIFEPDAKFTEIQVQMYDGVNYSKQTENYAFGGAQEDIPDRWEVFLGEDQKGLIALSKSGSGLKTVILVLLNLLVIPKLKEGSIDN